MMELYIVFYQSNKSENLYSICNSIEEAKKQFVNFIEIEQQERPTGLRCFETTKEDNFYEIADEDSIDSSKVFYHAVISYSRIPFNVFFSLEELVK